jgi:exopolyphosphatase/guanosine-5'-triphosphate,3'-diphosphate pyrophosphatase
LRIAVADIGSNSTRLLVAEVEPGGVVNELERRSEVTRLAAGVDVSGTLSPEAMERVFAALEDYRQVIGEAGGVDRYVGVMTSASRDAANGVEFAAQVAERFAIDTRVIEGDFEARLCFLGATSGRSGDGGEPTCVLDIGGGSTELIVGRGREVDFHVSTQLGVVRQSERHLHGDPPTAAELRALDEEVRETIDGSVPARVRESAGRMIAVAGTATWMASIDLGLERYDSVRIHGTRIGLERCREIAAMLASMPEAGRREVKGLHPDRAPTILTGAHILCMAMECFGVDEVEVSQHDILYGVALYADGQAQA